MNEWMNELLLLLTELVECVWLINQYQVVCISMFQIPSSMVPHLTCNQHFIFIYLLCFGCVLRLFTSNRSGEHITHTHIHIHTHTHTQPFVLFVHQTALPASQSASIVCVYVKKAKLACVNWTGCHYYVWGHYSLFLAAQQDCFL